MHKSLTFALIHIKWKYRVPFLTWSVFVSSRRAWLCYILIHNLTWAVSWFRGTALFQRGKNSSAQEIIFFCALFIINSKTLFKKQTAFSKSTMQKCDACLGLFLFAAVWEMNQDSAVLYRETKNSVSLRMSVCIEAPKSPRLCYVCGKWCSLTSYHKNHPGMRSRRSGGHIGRFAALTLAKDRSLAGWLLSWMNSFIAKSTRELVICPSFDGKITSEPNKTGSLTVFSKPLDWLMDTDKKSTLNLTRSFRAGGISCRFFEKVVFIYEQEKQKISPEEAKIQEFEISDKRSRVGALRKSKCSNADANWEAVSQSCNQVRELV